MNKVIGSTTTYHGTEHRYLVGLKVKIIAVIVNGARPDRDPDAEGSYCTDDETLAWAGGVTANDRVEVTPWMEKEQRFSFVTSDPLATDLACFAGLADKASR